MEAMFFGGKQLYFHLARQCMWSPDSSSVPCSALHIRGGIPLLYSYLDGRQVCRVAASSLLQIRVVEATQRSGCVYGRLFLYSNAITIYGAGGPCRDVLARAEKNTLGSICWFGVKSLVTLLPVFLLARVTIGHTG